MTKTMAMLELEVEAKVAEVRINYDFTPVEGPRMR